MRSSNVLVDIALLLAVPANTEEDTGGLSAESEKDKKRIAEFAFVKTMTLRRHEELMDDVKKRPSEEVSVWWETSRENTDGLITDMKSAIAHTVRMSMERDLALVRCKEHFCAPETLVDANVKRIVSLTDSFANI